MATTAEVLAASSAAASKAASMIGGTYDATKGGFVPNAKTNTGSSTNSSASVPGANPDQMSAVMQALTARLLKESGGVGSASSNADTTINNAITTLTDAQATNAKGINAKYDLAEKNVRDQASQDVTGVQEASSGFATNLAVLRKLSNDTEKSVRDLELQRQEALATGATDLASKISDLQVQKLKFQSDAEQQTFSNLLNASQLFLQQQQEARLTKAAMDDQEAKKAEIALKYGITLQPGQSLDDVVKAAMPYASQEEKLSIKKMEAEIAASNRSNRGSSASSVASYTLNQAATVFNNMAHIDMAGRKSTLNASKYVDPDVYMKLRDDFAVANGGKTSTFDNQFSPRLSPQDRARLGVGTASGVKAMSPEEELQAQIDAFANSQ